MAPARIALGNREKTLGIVELQNHPVTSVGIYTPNLLLRAIKAAKEIGGGEVNVELAYCQNGTSERSGRTLLIRFQTGHGAPTNGDWIAVAPRVEA